MVVAIRYRWLLPPGIDHPMVTATSPVVESVTTVDEPAGKVAATLLAQSLQRA